MRNKRFLKQFLSIIYFNDKALSRFVQNAVGYFKFCSDLFMFT